MRTFITALLLAFPLAASAATTVRKPTATIVLTGPQLAFLANWAQTIWPSLTPSDVDNFKCFRRQRDGTTGAICVVRATEAMSAADYLTELLVNVTIDAQATGDDISSDGSTVTAQVRYGPAFVTGTDVTALQTAVANAFSITPANLEGVHVWADSGGAYIGRAFERMTIADVDAMLGLRAGTYDKILE